MRKIFIVGLLFLLFPASAQEKSEKAGKIGNSISKKIEQNLKNKNISEDANNTRKKNLVKSKQVNKSSDLTSIKQNSKKINVKYLFGLSASMFSGSGFSFQYPFAKKHRIKIVGLVQYNSSNYYEEGENLYANIGMEWQYNLRETKYTRFYFLIGLGGSYSHESFSSPEEEDEIYIESSNSYLEIQRQENLGMAFGMEFLLLSSIALNFDLGYKLKKEWWNKRSATYTVSLGLGAGIHYAF